MITAILTFFVLLCVIDLIVRFVGTSKKRIHIPETDSLWLQLPRKSHQVGDEVELGMEDGTTAVYKILKIEPTETIDWTWYNLEFKNYKGGA